MQFIDIQCVFLQTVGHFPGRSFWPTILLRAKVPHLHRYAMSGPEPVDRNLSLIICKIVIFNLYCADLRNKKPPVREVLLNPCDPAGARTQDPNIKSVVLYQLSYGIIRYRRPDFPTAPQK